MKLQRELFNNAGDFVAKIYEKTASPRVYLAHNGLDIETNERHWNQRGHSLQDAIRHANEMQYEDYDDCYTTLGGYGWDKGEGKTVSAVRELTCFYVDFDYYNTEYADMSAGDFAQMVCNENAWLPVPTIVEDSGKGCWMIWKFKKTLHTRSNVNWLEQWQTYENFLVDQLRPYGADPACCDASRYMRLAGTINSKTKRTAEAWESGQSYFFNDLKKEINVRYKELEPERNLVRESNKPKKQKTGGKVSSLFNLHSLAWARMGDYKKLATLRGGRHSDHRNMVIWCYAVAAANYCKSEHSLRAEVEAFINGYVTESDKKLKTVNYESTVKRFNNYNELRQLGEHWEAINKQLGFHNNKYQHTTAYIVKTLEITEAEQRKLKVLIGSDEKTRRNTISRRIKRREDGAQARGDYDKERQAKVSVKASEALRLRLDGMSVRGIAEQMGCSVGSVHGYLKKSQEMT
jgi:hypothetical protein